MAKKLYINLDANDPSSALVVSQNSILNTDPPAFVFGDNVELSIYLCSDPGTGMTYDAASGGVGYSIKVGINIPGSSPTGGTYTLTYGANTTSALAYNADAAAIETALNLLASVTSAGGLDVTGTFPDFTITFRSNGARTALSGGSLNLTPTSTIVDYELTAGDGSTQEVQFIRIIRAPAALQATWTTITNGWNGFLSLRTPGILELLAGDAATVEGYLEIELTDPSGNRKTVVQVQITIRSDVIDSGSLTNVDLDSYYTTTESDAIYARMAPAVGSYRIKEGQFQLWNADTGKYHSIWIRGATQPAEEIVWGIGES